MIRGCGGCQAIVKTSNQILRRVPNGIEGCQMCERVEVGTLRSAKAAELPGFVEFFAHFRRVPTRESFGTLRRVPRVPPSRVLAPFEEAAAPRHLGAPASQNTGGGQGDRMAARARAEDHGQATDLRED